MRSGGADTRAPGAGLFSAGVDTAGFERVGAVRADVVTDLG